MVPLSILSAYSLKESIVFASGDIEPFCDILYCIDVVYKYTADVEVDEFDGRFFHALFYNIFPISGGYTPFVRFFIIT